MPIIAAQLRRTPTLLALLRPVDYLHPTADFADTAGASNPRAARLFAGALGLKGIGLFCALLVFAGASHCFVKGSLLNAAPTPGFALTWGR